MKKNFCKPILKIGVIGALCISLVIPAFVQAADIRMASGDAARSIHTALADVAAVLPIRYEQKHWSEAYIEKLSEVYDADSVFKDKNLNEAITLEDFQDLVKLTINKDYEGAPDSLSREAVVYEMARIWAEQTGQNLNEIAVIKMIIYADTEKIDPKYNHGVTVAYMKNIARGTGSRTFNPEPEVTYGELATLVYNTDLAIREELNSIEQPVSEERFETKGSFEIKDGNIVFDFELINRFSQPKELQFGSGQQFEIIVKDEDGDEAYRYSDGKSFTMALIYKTIKPGEAIKWQDIWDMTDKDGRKLTDGSYKAEIQVLANSLNENEEIDKSQLSVTLDFELTAEKIIKEFAGKLITAIKDKDAETVSGFVHPEKGVRFTAYTSVSEESDTVFTAEKMKMFFDDRTTYLWGYYDGIGSEIRLTPTEYYDQFIYSEDFVNAEETGYNEVLSSGNAVENQFEVYDNPIVVEYYFPGFNPEYGSMDWKSLRLVFEQYESNWKLVGVIHNQWTI